MDQQYRLDLASRLYIHSYRCLENVELPVAGKSSALLIDNNGSGKSTVAAALEVLQKIARGTNHVYDLVEPGDRSRGEIDAPMRFEIETRQDGRVYEYTIAISWFEARKASSRCRKSYLSTAV